MAKINRESVVVYTYELNLAKESEAFFMAEKARYWVGVLYPENMRADWQDEIGDIIGYPYAYCIHDKDVDSRTEERKMHVHLMVAYGNTTTEKSVLTLMNKLSADGRVCCPGVQSVANVRNMYEYLIHNTETCRKKNKHQYEKSERIIGNNFDIGNYEQISTADKNRMAKELCDLIIAEGFLNFADFYGYVANNFDMEYFDIVKSYSGLFDRIINGVWQKSLKTVDILDKKRM